MHDSESGVIVMLSAGEFYLISRIASDTIRDLRNMFGFNVSISEPALINGFLKFEDQIQAVYAQLEATVKKSEVLHIDR